MPIDISTILPAIIGAAATVIGALLVWLSKKSDKATQTLELALKQLGERVTEQDTKIEDLTKRLDFKDKQLGEQAREIRNLQDREQDREELLADYREHTLTYQLWLDDGGNPPIPKRSWRIRMDLEKEQDERR